MDNQKRIESLIQLLDKEPKDDFLNYALGLEYAKLSQMYVLAESQFKSVLENNGEYLAAYYQLGQLYELMEKRQLAIDFYQKGLNLAKTQKNNKAVNEFSEAIFLLED